MDGARRQTSRVQGGWAIHSRGHSSPDVDRAGVIGRIRPVQTTTVVDVPRSSTRTKASMSSSGYVFEQPLEEELPKDKKIQIITKPGVYEISDGPSGVSRVRLFHLYNTEEADALFAQLLSELPWMETPNVQNGVTTIEPRLIVWYGDHPYSYAGVTHEPSPKWPDVLLAIKQRLEESTGVTFNSVLGNLYRTGKDFVAWHSDDEPELGENPLIASFSFGDVRNFELRKKPADVTGGTTGAKPEYNEFVRMPLAHGSLLIMEGSMQSDWEHRIPVEYHDKRARINLTYRNILPPPPGQSNNH